MITLQSTPVTQYGSPGNQSFWGAAFNPQVFTFTRKDFVVGDIDPVNADLITVTVTNTLTTDQQIAILGTNVYIKTAVYNFSGKVISIAGIGTSFFVVEFSGGVSDSTGGFMNIDSLFATYRVALKISIAGQTIINYYASDRTGTIRADVKTFLKSFTYPEDLQDNNAFVYLDGQKFIPYTIAYAETYSGFVGGYTAITDTFYSVHSALQFNPYASNMAEYVTFVTPVTLAKFLTHNKEPQLYVGNPFDIGFIVTPAFAGIQLYVRVTPLDINGNIVNGGILTSSLLISPGNVLAISSTGVLLINHPENVFPITTNTGINRITVFDNYLPIVAYVDIQVFYLTGVSPTQTEHPVTEIKRIAILVPSLGENVYIKWLNLLGSWDYELFMNKNQFSLDVGAPLLLEREVLNYSNAQPGGYGTQDVINKTAQRKITVGKTGINKNRILALSGLLYSNKVYYLTNENPYYWETVIVDSKGIDQYDTDIKFGDFEVVLKRPRTNLQTY